MRLHGSLVAAVLAAGLTAVCASGASAASVDISGLVNANIGTYSDGNLYPVGPTPVTIGGVDFNLAGYPGGGTGVIQTGGTDSFSIPVSLAGVTKVYTIINSAYGTAGDTTGSLVFSDTAGDTYTYDLTEGVNVRDHFFNTFVNTAPDIYASQNYGTGDQFSTVRLDVQQIVLPAAFGSSTLDNITFNGINAGCCQGAPFLAAITTATAVPEPGAWALMLVGFGGLGWALRRRAVVAA